MRWIEFPQLLPRDVELAVKTLLDTMTHALAEGKRIELRGVGSLCLSCLVLHCLVLSCLVFVLSYLIVVLSPQDIVATFANVAVVFGGHLLALHIRMPPARLTVTLPDLWRANQTKHKSDIN